MSNRTCILIRNIGYGISCILAASGLALYGSNDAWAVRFAIASVVFFTAAWIFGLVFYRCPHCKGLLPIKEKHLEKCPHCKEVLKKPNG